MPATKLLYTQVVHKLMSRIGLQGTERENPDSEGGLDSYRHSAKNMEP